MTDIKSIFNYLDAHKDLMTEGQLNFVASLQKYYRRNKTLSVAQEKILNEINTSVMLYRHEPNNAETLK